jgi:hypothetical protein
MQVVICLVLLRALIVSPDATIDDIYIPHTEVEAIKVKDSISTVYTREHTYKITNGEEFKNDYVKALQECNIEN